MMMMMTNSWYQRQTDDVSQLATVFKTFYVAILAEESRFVPHRR